MGLELISAESSSLFQQLSKLWILSYVLVLETSFSVADLEIKYCEVYRYVLPLPVIEPVILWDTSVVIVTGRLAVSDGGGVWSVVPVLGINVWRQSVFSPGVGSSVGRTGGREVAWGEAGGGGGEGGWHGDPGGRALRPVGVAPTHPGQSLNLSTVQWRISPFLSGKPPIRVYFIVSPSSYWLWLSFSWKKLLLALSCVVLPGLLTEVTIIMLNQKWEYFSPSVTSGLRSFKVGLILRLEFYLDLTWYRQGDQWSWEK